MDKEALGLSKVQLQLGNVLCTDVVCVPVASYKCMCTFALCTDVVCVPVVSYKCMCTFALCTYVVCAPVVSYKCMCTFALCTYVVCAPVVSYKCMCTFALCTDDVCVPLHCVQMLYDALRRKCITPLTFDMGDAPVHMPNRNPSNFDLTLSTRDSKSRIGYFSSKNNSELGICAGEVSFEINSV